MNGLWVWHFLLFSNYLYYFPVHFFLKIKIIEINTLNFSNNPFSKRQLLLLVWHIFFQKFSTQNTFFLLKTLDLLPTMSEFFRLCLLHLIKFAYPMQLQSLCWNEVLCNYSQRSQFLGLRTDFVPVHLCLRADFRLRARVQVGTQCQLLQSVADHRPSRVVRVLLVAPLPQPQTRVSGGAPC